MIIIIIIMVIIMMITITIAIAITIVCVCSISVSWQGRSHGNSEVHGALCLGPATLVSQVRGVAVVTFSEPLYSHNYYVRQR